jgi:hypothetical protein
MSWIDALLVAAGVALALVVGPLAGVPLVALGLVMPALRLSARRRTGGRGVTHLVPPEVAGAYADLRSAAALDGVPDGPAVVAAADDGLLEVAAVLAGRPPRGSAQQRLVRVRVAAWTATAADLRAHHDSWREAVAEIDALAPGPDREDRPAAPGPASGALVGVLLVVLAPVFLAWELVTGSVRAAVALADGVALRARTAGRALVWAVRAAVVGLGRALRAAAAVLARTVRRWAELRRRVVAAAAEARGRFIAARLRVRLAVRRHG